MNYLSLFSGVGGFELGIQRAFDTKQPSGGKETGQTELNENMRQVQQRETLSEMPRSTRGKRASNQQDQLLTGNKPTPLCIGFSEIDKYAIQTYEKNWKGHRNYGSATAINERQLPDFELLVGGFPCQAFSVAGKRAGFDDTRGTLFFDIARILAHKRPRHFLLENVKGLLSHDSGKTMQAIAQVLADLGYRIEWQVLNAKDYGIPQNRERIFIVGHLAGECAGQVFPISGEDSTRIKEPPTIIGSSQRHAKVSTDGIVPTLSQAMGQGGGQTPMVVAQRGRANGQQLEPRKDGLTNTITSVEKDNYVASNSRIRRLIPVECERLMSWPDDYTYGVSDTQRYKQCGNGVVSNCVQAVIEQMINKGCL